MMSPGNFKALIIIFIVISGVASLFAPTETVRESLKILCGSLVVFYGIFVVFVFATKK
jgi:hypothetical protein